MRAFLCLLFVASLASCMLFIQPDEYGSVCRFKGEDTQCGACITTKCQDAVNACCRDESCDVTRVESCAQYLNVDCDYDARGNRAVTECIVRECGAVCDDFPGSPSTRCREPRLGEGAACVCEDVTATNEFVCNPKAFPDTLCCAPQGWPKPGLECTCRPLNCVPTNDGCFCRLVDFTPKQRECSAVHCCVDKDVCTCRADECSGFETEVESCNVNQVDCADGQIVVESCSAR
jgi:hypothetical protein